MTSILYVGQLWKGGTARARMETLVDMGRKVISFDQTPYTNSGFHIERSVLHRFYLGRGMLAFNQALRTFVRGQSFDIVWIDKGVFVTEKTLQLLRDKAHRKLVLHYTPDPQIYQNFSPHFVRCIPHYDFLVTTKPYEVDAYKSYGARNVITALQGYGPQFKPISPTPKDLKEFGSDVAFIGHCETHYADRLRAAATAVAASGAELAIWGQRWTRYARYHAWARPHVRSEGVWGDAYPLAISSSKIVLGLLSKLNADTATTRSFEIPACGAFMLAERTDEHLALFSEGKEAEFFSCDEEMQDKIRFFLAHESARVRIAAAGRDRCLKSGYSDYHQLQRILHAFECDN